MGDLLSYLSLIKLQLSDSYRLMSMESCLNYHKQFHLYLYQSLQFCFSIRFVALACYEWALELFRPEYPNLDLPKRAHLQVSKIVAATFQQAEKSNDCGSFTTDEL